MYVLNIFGMTFMFVRVHCWFLFTAIYKEFNIEKCSSIFKVVYVI